MLNSRGTTVLELVIVTVVIILLCLAAIPVFHGVRDHQTRTEVQELAAKVTSALASWHYRMLLNQDISVYPPVLDQNAVGAPCETCFDAVLHHGIRDALWEKTAETIYVRGRHRLVYDPAGGSLDLSITKY